MRSLITPAILVTLFLIGTVTTTVVTSPAEAHPVRRGVLAAKHAKEHRSAARERAADLRRDRKTRRLVSWCQSHPRVCRERWANYHRWCTSHPARCRAQRAEAQRWCSAHPRECARRRAQESRFDFFLDDSPL
ncbi:MAG: hypothetical protein HYV02_00140 [Deltaproteobacteria bacterium]|nr:hypothetical protein [Deltaproteobacteria bacterium]